MQTWPSLSISVANPDFLDAQRALFANADVFSPLLALRCWINPLSEPDVKLVQGVPLDSEGLLGL